MGRVFLDTRAVAARIDTASGPSARPKRGLTRRRFLQGMGATAGVALYYANARASQALNVESTSDMVRLTRDGASIWSIDISWLAGRPQLKAQKRGEVIEISLSGARYPGTPLAADFRATLFDDLGSSILRMQHSLSRVTVEVDLSNWLSGNAPLMLQVSGSPFSAAVGNFLQIQQVASAQVLMMQTLELRASAAKGWAVKGSEFYGSADAFAVSRATGAALIGGDELRRAHIVLTPGASDLRMMPVFSPSSSANVSVGPSALASLLVESAEEVNGERHQAFLSQGSGLSVVSQRFPSEASGRVLAHNPSYARSLISDGESQALWVAAQGQGMASFGPHTLVTAPVSDRQTIKLTEASGSCSVECDAHLQSLSLASDEDVSITLRFQPPRDSAINQGVSLSGICPFTFRHKELSLDGAEITFKRPANALLLRFRFQGFKLIRGWQGIKLVVTDRAKCRLHLLVGAQSVVEEAFFEPPAATDPTPDQKRDRKQRFKSWLETQYDRSKAPPAGRDEFVRKAMLQQDLDSMDPSGPEWDRKNPPTKFPSRARIAHDSQLVYRLKPSATAAQLKSLSLDLHRLLDEKLWELVVVQDAASTEEVRKKPLDSMVPQADKAIAPHDATYLEIPAALFISPNERASFRAEGLDTRSPSRFKDIFRIAGVAQSADGIPLRAIGARGFTKDVPPGHFDPKDPGIPDPIGFRTPTDMRDRIEFVWLTSQWGQNALPGTQDVRERNMDESGQGAVAGFDGVYVPRAFDASKLLLSAMGGSMKSLGRWDPPAFSEFALSVERWEHSSIFARSDVDVVVYKGFLLPLGIRCSLIKVTRRQERRLNDMGVMSLPIQKFFIEVANPKAEYTGALAPSGGRTWPFRSIELLLRGRLQIDDPALTGLCGLGQSAFRICVGKDGYRFKLEIDGDPKRRGNACLAFIDNTVAHSLSDLVRVTDTFNTISPDLWATAADMCGAPAAGQLGAYYMEIENSKIQYAPPKQGDDTSYLTGRMFVWLRLKRDLVNSAIIEASGKPPTFPEMQQASVVIPALNRLTGRSDNTVTDVTFAQVYTDIGFDAKADNANTSEVFLKLLRPVTASFSGNGDRSGAVASPGIDAYFLSRQLGIMGNMPKPVTPERGTGAGRLAVRSSSSRVSFNGADLFRTDALLLGVMPMSQVFDALGLEDVPKFVESAKHKIDAAADEVASKICQFVTTGVTAAAELIGKLGENIKYEPVQVLKGDLENFKSALEVLGATNCTPGQLDLVLATKQIALAGAALDKARRTIEDITRNPSMLLPAPVRSLVEFWTNLVKGVVTKYSELRDLVQGARNSLPQHIREVQQTLTDQANAVIAAELNQAYSQLSHSIERILAASVPVERHIQQFLDIFNVYASIYKGMAGWYREFEANKDTYRTVLAGVANEVIFQARSNAASYVALVTTRIEAPLRQLDASLRQWGQLQTLEAQEQGRAFFRRYEPSITTMANALVGLIDLQAKYRDVPVYIDGIILSLDELSVAVTQEMASSATVAEFRSYLPTVQSRVDLTRRALADAGMALKDVKTAGGVTVAAAVGNLKGALVARGATVLPAVISDAQKAWAAGIATPVEVDQLVRTTNDIVQLFVVASAGLENAVKALDKVDDLILPLLNAINDGLVQWLKMVVPGDPPPWVALIKDYGYLLAPEFVANVKPLSDALVQARDQLDNGRAALSQPASAAFQAMSGAIKTADARWQELTTQFKALGEAPDRLVMEAIKGAIANLAEQLVPAEIHLDFNLNTPITKNVGNVFKKGTAPDDSEDASLSLAANIRQNLRTGESSAEFRGKLARFRLNLLGFLTITFEEVKFEALSGAAPKLYPPTINNVSFDGCLAFVNDLKGFFSGEDGPYVTPLPGGIKAGYRLKLGTIPVGPMIIQNLVLDAGIEIPYDNRAALTTFAVSSRQSPALLFVAPYGGTMFFGLGMAGDRLASVEASFEAGLVAAFDLGAVVGTGRVTFGFYYRQTGSVMNLEGFFFAGGQGTVLSIVSISVSLRIGLAYRGSNVTGFGEFSVEVGAGPFKWSLDYRVERDIGRLNANANVAKSSPSMLSQDKKYPIANLETDSMKDLFLDRSTWRDFKSAFADLKEAV